MIGVLLITAALMQAAPDDPEETACYERDESQQGMNICAGEAYERAEGALNAQWAKVLAQNADDVEARAVLSKWQDAWLKYRDASCELAALGSRGGSIWPMEIAMCAAVLTRKRTRELVDLLEGDE